MTTLGPLFFKRFKLSHELRLARLLDSKEVLDLNSSQSPGVFLSEFDMFSLPEGVNVFVKCVSPVIDW